MGLWTSGSGRAWAELGPLKARPEDSESLTIICEGLVVTYGVLVGASGGGVGASGGRVRASESRARLLEVSRYVFFYSGTCYREKKVCS